jgi:hypothetical protein
MSRRTTGLFTRTLQRIVIRHAPIFLVAFVCVVPAHPQTPIVPCQRIEFGGEVSEKQPFEVAFGAGLAFRLRPELQDANPPGWTIEVAQATDKKAESDYVRVATPPFRSANPRDLTVDYDFTAQDVVKKNQRQVYFVLNDPDYERMTRAEEIILGPNGHSEQEISVAQDVFDKMKVATGNFHILDAKTSDTVNPQEGRVTWLKFEVSLCVPCDFAVSPGLKADRTGCGARPAPRLK